MTKYVGKHRTPPKWTTRKTIASTIAVAGILTIASGSVQARPKKISVSTSTITTSISKPVYKEYKEPPDLPGNGDDELNAWLEKGAPGYIPDPKNSKGLVSSDSPKPHVTVVQAVCNRGPASALGLSPNAATVYEAVCALFPEVTEFGGLRVGDPQDHGSGNAIDCMIDSVNGDILAQWLLDHWNELPLKYIIWEQKISYGKEWIGMEDRGSPTQNHYDHIHISVN